MSFVTDIATDQLGFEGGVAVTLNQRRGGQVNAIACRNATSGPLGYRQIMALQGLVGLNGKEVNWNLMTADVGANGVSPGDQIDDGTNVWNVLAATQTTLTSRWKCVCSMIDPTYS